MAHINQKLNPKCVKLALRPYNRYDFGHDLEVDIDVYYHWQEYPVLHVRVKQEPIPFIPMEVLTSSAWHFLEVDFLDKKRIYLLV